MSYIVNNPHDLLAKVSLKDKVIAQAICQGHLPCEVTQRIDFETFRPCDTEHVSSHLNKLHSDIVYECRIDGDSGYVYMAIEHQSTADQLMSFRHLQYEVALMDAHLKRGYKKLPTVISLCLYHGRPSPYPYSTDIYDCFENPDFARQYALKPFHLIDLTNIHDKVLEKHGSAALFEMLLKYQRKKSIMQLITRLAKSGLLRTTIENVHSSNYFRTVLDYITTIEEDPHYDMDAFLAMLTETLPKQVDDIMTLGDRLIERGVQKGIEQGIENERLNIAKNMLCSKKFSEQEIVSLTRLSLKQLRTLQ